MRRALDEAARAPGTGDVPVGAVVLSPDGTVIGTGRNEREATGDPTAHAEILAIREAARTLRGTRSDGTPSDGAPSNGTPSNGTPSDGTRSDGTPSDGARSDGTPSDDARQPGDWRLTGCTLVVTLEPCTMCAGAIVLSRLDRVVYGAADEKAGAAGSLWDVVRDRRLNHRPEVITDVLAAPCADLLTTFFRSR
ncbi:nucleoside deaminase [Streptomyces paromomycinus]|nr:nucleoside deaminase [Streptomyces paromomycinus]